MDSLSYWTKKTCPLSSLTEKQIALREFLGEYQPIENIEMQWQNDTIPVESKKSRLHALFAEGMAIGEIYQRYYGQTDAWGTNRFADPNKEYSGLRHMDSTLSPQSIREQIAKRSPVSSFGRRNRWIPKSL